MDKQRLISRPNRWSNAEFVLDSTYSLLHIHLPAMRMSLCLCIVHLYMQHLSVYSMNPRHCFTDAINVIIIIITTSHTIEYTNVLLHTCRYTDEDRERLIAQYREQHRKKTSQSYKTWQVRFQVRMTHANNSSRRMVPCLVQAGSESSVSTTQHTT